MAETRAHGGGRLDQVDGEVLAETLARLDHAQAFAVYRGNHSQARGLGRIAKVYRDELKRRCISSQLADQ
jgi:hypothetical protein